MADKLFFMFHFLKFFLAVTVLSLLLFFGIFQAASAQYQLGEFAGGAGYQTNSKAPTIETIVQKVINTGLSLVGIIFLGLTLYAGIRWMTAQGNEEHVTKAKEILQAGMIGLVVVTMSYAITNIIFKNLPQTEALVDNSTEPQPDNKKTAGQDCTDEAECASGGCVDKKCTAVTISCTSDADCTDPGSSCVNGNCKNVSDGTSVCKPPCDANYYCALVSGVAICKPGCAKNSDCLSQTGESWCDPLVHSCKFPQNLGSKCGEFDVGRCQVSSVVDPLLSAQNITGDNIVCSGDGTVLCFLLTDKCLSNYQCGSQAACNTVTHTCDNSPKANCQKLPGYLWGADIFGPGHGMKKCFLKTESDECKSKSDQCVKNCDSKANKCIADCKSKYPTLNQDRFNCYSVCTKQNPITKKISVCQDKKCVNEYIDCLVNLTNYKN